MWLSAKTGFADLRRGRKSEAARSWNTVDDDHCSQGHSGLEPLLLLCNIPRAKSPVKVILDIRGGDPIRSAR